MVTDPEDTNKTVQFPSWVPDNGTFAELRWPTEQDLRHVSDNFKLRCNRHPILFAKTFSGEIAWINRVSCKKCLHTKQFCSRQDPSCARCQASGSHCDYTYSKDKWVNLTYRHSAVRKSKYTKNVEPGAFDETTERREVQTKRGRKSRSAYTHTEYFGTDFGDPDCLTVKSDKKTNNHDALPQTDPEQEKSQLLNTIVSSTNSVSRTSRSVPASISKRRPIRISDPQSLDFNWPIQAPPGTRWVATKSDHQRSDSSIQDDNVFKPPIWFSNLEEFQTVYPEYQDARQILAWRKGFPHILVLSEGNLYHEGSIQHSLEANVLTFTLSRTLERSPKSVSGPRKGAVICDSKTQQSYSQPNQTTISATTEICIPPGIDDPSFDQLHYQKASHPSCDRHSYESPKLPFDIQALQLAGTKELEIGVFLDTSCNLFPYKLHPEVKFVFLEYFHVKNIQEISESVQSCSPNSSAFVTIRCTITMNKLGENGTPWWIHLAHSIVPDLSPQRFLEPMATDGQRLHGAWHCPACGKISKRIKLNGWWCSSPTCNNSGPRRDPLSVDEVKPRFWATNIDDIDSPPMMGLNIRQIQFESFARVTTFTESGSTLTKIHITDHSQLEWTEKAFRYWQSDVDFRLMVPPKKVTDIRFDFVPKQVDFDNRWVSEVRDYMQCGLNTYGNLSTEYYISAFLAYAWSGKGKASLSTLINTSLPSQGPLLILALGATIDFHCHRQGTRFLKGKEARAAAIGNRVGTRIQCVFSLKHGSLFYLDAQDAIDIDIERDGFTMVVMSRVTASSVPTEL